MILFACKTVEQVAKAAPGKTHQVVEDTDIQTLKALMDDTFAKMQMAFEAEKWAMRRAFQEELERFHTQSTAATPSKVVAMDAVSEESVKQVMREGLTVKSAKEMRRRTPRDFQDQLSELRLNR
jgi:hypothetical protein